MNSAKILTGWIRPNGSWIDCGRKSHLDAAKAAGESHPDEAGWIHVNFEDMGFLGFPAVEPVSHMTQKQLDTLGEVCVKAGQSLPFWVQDVELTS